MCTPVYVTVKTAATAVPMVHYIAGIILLAIGAAASFFAAFKVRKHMTKITATKTTPS